MNERKKEGREGEKKQGRKEGREEEAKKKRQVGSGLRALPEVLYFPGLKYMQQSHGPIPELRPDCGMD